MKQIVTLPTLPHGGQLRHIAARFGVQAGNLLDFSANINPIGPPASVIRALQSALADPVTLTAYPDLELTQLRLALASSLAVEPCHISIANGFVPLLDAALRSRHIKRCLLPIPCFSEYRRTLENAQVTVVPYQLEANKHFRYDPEALAQASRAHSCDAILLANPQNPSGVVSPSQHIKRLIEIANSKDMTILLDEAFIDYCSEHSLSQSAPECPGLVVFRSLTKFFGIPGLRVAYALSHSSDAGLLNRYIAPWPVTSFVSAAVCAALLDDAFAAQSRFANQRQRAWLERELSRLGIMTSPSNANFLLLRFPHHVQVDLLWKKMIVSRHIVLRSCADFEGLGGGYLRLAIRTESENNSLIQSLDQALRELK